MNLETSNYALKMRDFEEVFKDVKDIKKIRVNLDI
jgi:hypothetical protein